MMAQLERCSRCTGRAVGRGARSRRATVDPIFGRPLSFYLFTLPAWQLVSGWLMTLAVWSARSRAFFVAITGGTRMLGGAPRHRARRRLARPVDRLRRRAADARRARLPRTVRAAVRGSHDLRRRHLYRCARHAHRHARRVGRARRRRGARARQRRVGAAGALARPRRRAGGVCYVVVGIVGGYVDQLHRQAERARARERRTSRTTSR